MKTRKGAGARGPELLYSLLPLVYRVRDADRGEPLRALLGVVGEEYDRLHDDLDRLYADWFIETCHPSVIPFLGDLVGVPRPPDADDALPGRRTVVANALRYRRRKGISAVLERALLDATGWPACAVEMFEHLAVTQDVDHDRIDRGRLFDVRAGLPPASPSARPGADVVGPGARTADVRPIDATEGRKGRFNPQTIALLVSRLTSYPVERSEPCQVKDGGFTFHPLGLDTPLFSLPRTDGDPLEPRALADLPLPIPPRAFAADLAGSSGRAPGSRWYGPSAGVEILRDGQPLPPALVVAADLGDWTAPAKLGERVAVDVTRGRLLVAPAPGAAPPELRVSWAFGRAMDLGAAPYRRPARPRPAWYAEVDKGWLPPPPGALPPPGPPCFPTLREAIAAWAGAATDGAIRIRDSATYGGDDDRRGGGAAKGKDGSGAAPSAPARLTIPLGARRLTLEAGAGEHPTLDATLAIEGAGGDLTLDGLEIRRVGWTGGLHLNLDGCTVLEAIEDLSPKAGAPVEVTLALCLTGPVRMAGSLVVTGSLVDGGAGPAIGGPKSAGAEAFGPAATLTRSTLLGPVAVEAIGAAEDCLFAGAVRVRRPSPGLLRFCALPHASAALPRHRGVLFGAPPDAAGPDAVAELPRFRSRDRGDPSYGRLAGDTAPEILAGAHDGGEIGAFHDAHERRRLAALHATLDDFLPAGLSAGPLFLD